jgi:hypothetical protein
MKIEYYNSIASMLSLQLKEEEANYEHAVMENKQFHELGKIEQRIKSLQRSLLSLNNWLQNLSNSEKLTDGNNKVYMIY